MPLVVDQAFIDALIPFNCYVGWSYGEEADVGDTLANPYIFSRSGAPILSCMAYWYEGWSNSGTATFQLDANGSAYYTGWNITYDSIDFDITLGSAALFTINQGMLDAFSANDASLLVNGNPAVLDMEVEAGDILTAVANTGFAIATARIQGIDTWGQRTNFDFTVNDPPLTATLDVTSSLAGYPYYDARATTFPYTPAVEGSNRVYKITHAILDEVNEQRFSMSGGAPVDFGQYILGLIKLPFDINPDLVGIEAPIQLGELTLTVEAHTVKTDSLSLSLGDITTPAPNGNSLDHLNTKCTLHLPYAKSIDIDPDYVIGETISIEYIIDLYNGKTTINVSSSKLNGEVFQTQTADLGLEIPYITTRSTTYSENMGISLGGDNHIRTPFIEVIRSDSVLPSGFFTAPIEDEGTLASYTGYLEGIEVELLTGASLSEKLDIVSKLKGGVIIK